MGGNALKEYGTVRLDSRRAHLIGNHVLSYIQQYNPAVRAAIVKSYTNKLDHGDIDIVVSNTIDWGLGCNYIADSIKAFNLKHGRETQVPIIHNGPVHSLGFPVKGGVFQTDLIAVPDESFDFALSYFNWNDLGNLMGRVAHKLGLKFGHDGLWLPLRDEDYLIKEIELTKNFEKAITFLGFNYVRYMQGFTDLEDIFQYVVGSNKFNRNLYPLEHCNHTQRIRDRKRPTYMNFLRWLEKNYQIPNQIEYPNDKSVWLPAVFSEFAHAEQEYNAVVARREAHKQVKLQFNGFVVHEWTGLHDKELGRLMRSIKSQFLSMDDFIEFMTRSTPKEIKELTLHILSTLNQQVPEDIKSYRKILIDLVEQAGGDTKAAQLIAFKSNIRVDNWSIANAKHPENTSYNVRTLVHLLRNALDTSKRTKSA